MAARIDPKLKKAYEFFKKHAGYVVGKQAEGALALARAEAAAEALGWTYEWKSDDEGYDAGTEDEDYEPEEVLVCILLDQDGEFLDNLGGIADPDRNDGRVVEAELAHAALARKKLL